MKVPNYTALTAPKNLSLSRLQNEGSQLSEDTSDEDIKSIKATE